MRKSAGAWRGTAIVQELHAQIPVSSYCILDNVRILKEREWYIRETIRFGLSHRGPQTPICPIRIS